jgi:hypothetical protein
LLSAEAPGSSRDLPGTLNKNNMHERTEHLTHLWLLCLTTQRSRTHTVFMDTPAYQGDDMGRGGPLPRGGSHHERTTNTANIYKHIHTRIWGCTPTYWGTPVHGDAFPHTRLDRSHGPADLKTKEPTPQLLQTTDDHLHMLTPSNTTHVPRNGTANPRHEGSLGINPGRTKT